MAPLMKGVPSPSKRFAPTPAQTFGLTHAVKTNKAGAGGALQGSWDVPSAHSIDRTSSQFSITDQFEAAQAIQRVARGKEIRTASEQTLTHADFAQQVRQLSPPKGGAGRAPTGPGAFDQKDMYAPSPYGEGYGFVNNPHDQFGSTRYFNESKTSDLADPKPTAQMRVKSGYTGHVPKGRDHIGSTYRMHDNRGTAGKSMVPIPHHDISAPNDEFLAKMKRNLTYHAGQSAVFQGRMTGGVGGGFTDSHSGPSTVKIPDRIEKLLEREDAKGPDGTIATASIGDEHDAKYIKGTGAPNPMAGYTGHVPRAREVIGSTFNGPSVGASYHGPAMVDDSMGFVLPSSPNKCAECP